jgi:hypothetical protein
MTHTHDAVVHTHEHAHLVHYLFAVAQNVHDREGLSS